MSALRANVEEQCSRCKKYFVLLDARGLLQLHPCLIRPAEPNYYRYIDPDESKCNGAREVVAETVSSVIDWPKNRKQKPRGPTLDDIVTISIDPGGKDYTSFSFFDVEAEITIDYKTRPTPRTKEDALKEIVNLFSAGMISSSDMLRMIHERKI